jgi:hypothetical protein
MTSIHALAIYETGSSQKREDFFKYEAMLLRILCGAGILDKHECEAETGALARSELDAYVAGNAGEHNSVYAP